MSELEALYAEIPEPRCSTPAAPTVNMLRSGVGYDSSGCTNAMHPSNGFACPLHLSLGLLIGPPGCSPASEDSFAELSALLALSECTRVHCPGRGSFVVMLAQLDFSVRTFSDTSRLVGAKFDTVYTSWLTSCATAARATRQRHTH